MGENQSNQLRITCISDFCTSGTSECESYGFGRHQNKRQKTPNQAREYFKSSKFSSERNQEGDVATPNLSLAKQSLRLTEAKWED
jgi:hypothetical protein